MKKKHILFVLLALWSCTSAVFAQQQEFTFYQASETFDRAQLKQVIQAVLDLDPTATVFHSDDMRVLQIKHAATTGDAPLRATINTTGLSLLPGTPDLKALYGEAPDTPVYIATGDPKGDHERYVSAVEQWNATNPDQQLPDPIPYVDEQ